ncbi:Mur ligase family protein [uncultured Muribaculum sp.]|jgi:UDP-N-acetylmuramate--alanine ligase|uniref:UDP-N-acetylmuramate--L-alanine ligase n=1 Tax=uncultured Muribaculum sp. TaxID=1918613 RepID=UPI0025AF8260|nr:Mur ligase family protein [uncultured Muribaculum sp.]
MQPQKIYFAGAGGIGMAALERYFLSKGYRVAGYDRTETELTRQLAKEGVEITYNDTVEAIPADFRDCPQQVQVVYTPALPSDHPQLSYFRSQGYPVLKRSQVLGLITKGSKSLCFAGTHGKTTTSSMAAHLLNTSPVGCNAFLGGILRNYNSNLLLSATSPYSVVEADEYDRSFHQLAPYIAVINATDPDHLDIYGTEDAYLESFAHFTELIRPDGFLLLHTGLKLKPRPGKGVRTYTFGRNDGDFHAKNIRYSQGSILFDLVTPWNTITDLSPGIPVDINIDNAIAAIAAVLLTGEQITDQTIRQAMSTFKGPKRRFEFWLKRTGQNGKPQVIVDDYAHHPDEIRASIRSIRALYPESKLTVVFQPHLFSRTRDFATEFAQSLSEADSVILLPIYPAREEPIPGISSETILNQIDNANKMLAAKQNLIKTIKNSNFEVLLTLGAGDICDMLPEILSEVNSL